MPGYLTSHSYGKHRVRVSKIVRPRQTSPGSETHHFVEASVDVELTGAFAAAYTDGDNRSVIATDTCKNTIYALAKDDSLESIESFGLAIAGYFLQHFSHVSGCQVALSERVWTRLCESPHAFMANERATPGAEVNVAREEEPVVSAGFEHLLIAKTTESGFRDFHQSEFRTLADTDDRVLATELSASWVYDSTSVDFTACRQAITQALLAKFTDHYSHSVQETLYLMAQAALDACAAATQITLNMPNKHHLLADLTPFGRENDNEIFVVTDEPFGHITATLARE